MTVDGASLRALLDDFAAVHDSHPDPTLEAVHLAVMLEETLGVVVDEADIPALVEPGGVESVLRADADGAPGTGGA